MNTHPFKLISNVAAFSALALCLAPLSSAKAYKENKPPAQHPAIAGAAPLDPSAIPRRVAKHTLRNENGAELGTIEDFVVDPDTTQLYALVVSTRESDEDTGLRLVPSIVLRGSSNGELTTRIDEEQWSQLATVSREDFDRGQMSGTGNARLVRMSQLCGKTVRADDRDVGEIKEVVVNVDEGIAIALLEPSSEFDGPDGVFLVPLNMLVLGSPEEGAIATTLSREDFARAQGNELGIASGERRRGLRQLDEPALPPTGRVAPDEPPTGNPDDALAISAQSVRRALKNDAMSADANVQVSHENNRIVLRGRVSTEEQKQSVGRIAKDTASDVEIENRLTVEK